MRSPYIQVQIRPDKEKSMVQYTLYLLNVLHFVLTVTTFYFSWMMFKYQKMFETVAVGYRYNYFVLLGYAVLLFFFLKTYNAYYLGYIPVKRLVFYQFLSQFLTVGALYIVVSIAWKKLNNPLPFVVLLASQIVIDIIWTIICNSFYIRTHHTRRVVLVYGTELDRKFFDVLKGKPSEKLYSVERYLQYSGDDFNEILEKIRGYDAVFSAGVHLHCRNEMMKFCKEANVPIFFMPTVGDVIIKESGHLKSFDAPVFFVTRSHANPEYAIVKRLFDIFFSAFGLIVAGPFMLVTALAIHFYDGGPVIYRQTRLTKDGKKFQIYKFRSMRVDAEKDGVARFSTGDNDDRITPVGRIVRKIRMDELPQLWNILRGDMSFIGPRPERPEIAEQFYEHFPDFRLRLQTKAGLTGYAQVYGRYNSDPYEKLIFDLLYINHQDFKTDIMLFFATIAIIFSSNSTKGFEKGNENLKSLTQEEYTKHGVIHEEI